MFCLEQTIYHLGLAYNYYIIPYIYLRPRGGSLVLSLRGDQPRVQATGPVDPVGPVGLVDPVGAGEGGRHVGELSHPASLASWAPSH